MPELFINRISKVNQVLISIGLVSFISALCFAFKAFIDYRVVAFILLLLVSVVAMSFDIIPVFITAVFSALVWDFFFIPPHYTFQVGTTEDSILLLMYFVIALINAALTYKIRQIEKQARLKEEKAHAIKLYDTLLNSLSHELRTPISTIIAATDNLQSNNSNLTDANRHELVDEIAKASFRLDQQVENLLSMSRLESGVLRPKKDWCDIIELIYDVVKRVEENGSTQKININVNPDIPLFKLDKKMLEQILYNILNNAVQYTKEDSTIQVIAHGYADVLEIIIEDDGPGFPEDEIDEVFGKFYRLRNTKTGGTGLGLSIVKGFSEAMNGSVHLQNIPTGGSRFTIQIVAEKSNLKSLKHE